MATFRLLLHGLIFAIVLAVFRVKMP